MGSYKVNGQSFEKTLYGLKANNEREFHKIYKNILKNNFYKFPEKDVN